ncbi:lytic transglycosylase [Streptomyces sp. WAC05374]|uniref:transglycosylase SLT domain-containing protein n=1 Tax=Streptomyces sp. WAC05374 TaxID=2487420 RepID=UPI000F86AEBD|nr:transglycosylase SLT domain-containing protein [Streptomyces sp. WAC05374]RST11564.1 lytic transglycosylase [Streptomyces sp. WAC05374]TDF35902.1 lytic transglycosylase [Streptomyces sp. WAC05374]TDF49305.1 lytic transglycosylase [Streptomyces sp. WAC05374]TDF55174.1 lytic transglycosylase [Streptomyces sp. WAC05374]
MSASSTRRPGFSRLKQNHKLSLAGIATLSAAALAFSVVPGNDAAAETEPQAVAAAPAAAPVALTSTLSNTQSKPLHLGITEQQTTIELKAKADAAAAKAKAQAAAAAKAKAQAAAAAKAKAQAQAAAKKRAAAKAAASRAAARKPVFANNLDGWIREALFIMKKHNIPGTYDGIHRNIMRESSGNPRAINNWDINAINGVPSKGLLQVIYPTFKAYHVPGTKFDQYDPVANIVAACNYAADRYGSMDNVNSAY